MNKITIFIICALLIASLHSATVDLTTTTFCSCDTFTTQGDCQAQNSCAWSASACAAVNCTSYAADACNSNANCALQSDLKTCATFTKCADYSYANATQCVDIGCTAGAINGTNYPCVDVVIKKCTEITDSTECTTNGCAYNTTCAAPKCADQAQDKCNTLRGDSLTQIQFCAYNATCADAEMNLNQTACAVQTAGSYYWNADNSLCESCADSQSYGYLIAAFGTMMLNF